MEVIHARNVHTALPIALDRLNGVGVVRESRNGAVRMFPTPVTTVYERPQERVVFWDVRDANPFFHLMESLWMLAGHEDVGFPSLFVKRMVEYSDDGQKFNAAYGFRWRKHFGFDQLEEVVQILREDPNSRQAIVQIWDNKDLTKKTKDKACNMLVQFQINHRGELDMQVTNRSNDIVWGAYGANAVHFSYLHEYMASAINVPLGQYYQISNNFHLYDYSSAQVEGLAGYAERSIWHGQGIPDPYKDDGLKTFPLINTALKEWKFDLQVFMENGPITGLRDPFFTQVVTPMWHAYFAYKKGEGSARFELPLEILQQCKAEDWKRAAEDWIHRRKAKAVCSGS